MLNLTSQVFAQFDARLGDGDTPVALAVSGGSDSVALMRLAAAWGRRRVIVLTVDHRLRAEATAEAAQVGRWATDLGLPHQTLTWTSPRAGQAAARTARHALLAGAARSAGAANLLLGHTQDDLLETYIMRRGVDGTNARDAYGLAGMPPVAVSPVWPAGAGVTLIRPLLAMQRAELRRWLRHSGHAWIDDPSNLDAKYERVRARQTLQEDADLRRTVMADLSDLSLQRAMTDRAVADWLAGAVTVRSDAAIEVNLSGLPAAEPLAHAMAWLIQIAAGTHKRPRRGHLDALLARLLAADMAGTTLGGALVARRGSRVTLWRDPAGASASQAVTYSNIWDGRFMMDRAAHAIMADDHRARRCLPPDGATGRAIGIERLAHLIQTLRRGAQAQNLQAISADPAATCLQK